MQLCWFVTRIHDAIWLLTSPRLMHEMVAAFKRPWQASVKLLAAMLQGSAAIEHVWHPSFVQHHDWVSGLLACDLSQLS